ncbi:glucosyltransferase (Die2), putative [Talaromyces stipitatus ATCC 10500]|uniref:Dol-P-Glc:Glc(2)Man(9)GlcNAc(2)-PP-Dol alpha-1,2-glucosyltransferase n=1 Tax=Talaromyces stipitatus (strain ATCC 10500 / CBS 375.48 / QM 6759 / NRRL 1006) TaxID=441959 RepID=B8M8V0_TALSN|nr:glucosyltransferase (Die2), putative [Talaromyces stipitatus ATCC 10500]EED20613.1 glucosyltransferase (Die2), putative [Talaromyces stipitatus ATCC 10500]
MSSPQAETGLTLAGRYLVPFFLLSFMLWRKLVNDNVQESYLDEVFHVGQAQTYWRHDWFKWDPKITTPPGLYLWSYFDCAGRTLLRGSSEEVDVFDLRSTNSIAAAFLLPWRLQTLLDSLRKEQNTRAAGAWLSHTVLNICLFPPLFFFSGLYYTDILALIVVIQAYIWDTERSDSNGQKKTAVDAIRGHVSLKTLAFVGIGCIALVFRQTNIFWVSVFMGGLQAVRTIRQNTKPCAVTGAVNIVRKSFQAQLYDPLVSEASFIDYFKTALSLACGALSELPLLVASIVPHLTILGAFGAFVLWNGSVVLGHKEFHTASIHLPQMLYIWPYFVFFSFPFLSIGVLNAILPRRFIPKYLDYNLSNGNRLPSILTALTVIPLMLAAVHFNTIVHPFTLADNRHYVFYVFRLLTRYHPAVKYAAVPVYFLCAWSVITAFGVLSPPSKSLQLQIATPQDAFPSYPETQQKSSKREEKEAKKQQKKQASKSKSASTAAKSPSKQQAQQAQVLTPEILAKIQAHVALRQQQRDNQQIRISFVLIWLIATTLSLITAPLVEPRYFIIPWVMWRLHLPRQPTPEVFQKQQQPSFKAQFFTALPEIMETVWFLFINAVTGYVFLYKGFEWPQEPGKVQRFLW